MRETKYRVWDLLDEVMVYGYSEWTDKEAFGKTQIDEMIIYPSSQTEEIRNSTYLKISYTKNDWDVYRDVKIEERQGRTMKLTGRKDKSGVEIYEGDILKNEGGELEIVKITWTEPAHPIGYVVGYYFSEPPHDLEIVGNIHKNPELLKD